MSSSVLMLCLVAQNDRLMLFFVGVRWKIHNFMFRYVWVRKILGFCSMHV